MKKKFLKVTIGTMLACSMLSTTALASGLTQDAAGIHYQKDDGSIVTSSWVEISNIWYYFDDYGNCTTPNGVAAQDVPDDGKHQIYTSYVPYSTGDLDTLLDNIVKGNVVCINGQYYCTPEYATASANVVEYVYDVNPEPTVDRTAFADMDIHF